MNKSILCKFRRSTVQCERIRAWSITASMMLLFHSAGWAVAQSDTATWDASSSNWSDTTHWNHSNVAASGLVPNNGNGGFTYGVVVPGGTVAQNLAGGVTISSLSIDPAARLDLTTGSATINYGLSPSPIATIKGYLVTGRNGGFWNGPGIDSSAVAADSSGWSRYAVGWQDTGQHVIVKYTLNGDSTLDGVVDFNDLLLVAKNYNNQFGTTSWRLGDFNYDGITNWFDLLIVSQNYNRRLQPPPIILDLSSHSLTDRSSAVATVPEPACIGFACGLILLTRGRRQYRVTGTPGGKREDNFNSGVARLPVVNQRAGPRDLARELPEAKRGGV